MMTDAQGNELTGASPAAVALFDAATDEFLCYRDDPLETVGKAVRESPDFAMGHIFRAHLFLSATEKGALAPAAASVAKAKARARTEREKGHLAALDACLRSDFQATRDGLEAVLTDYPRDALALQMAHLWDFYCGDSQAIRDRAVRHAARWGPQVPCYHAVLGMQAFGHEEMGDYAKAEALGREAIAINPADAWAQHAVAHVMEMQNRLEEGIAWMRDREADWTRGSLLAIHNWWHLALFHLDRGDTAAVLELYDRHIRGERSSLALDMLDASALLWRLNLRGVEAGDRWADLADDWAENGAPGYYAFNDAHAIMAYLGAGRAGKARETLDAMTAALGSGGDNDAAAREAGIPAAGGLIAFAQGDYAGAVTLLAPVRQALTRIGGSHAQRDVFDLTLTEAALRAGDAGLVRSLVRERLATRPKSPTNLMLARRAEGPGAL